MKTTLVLSKLERAAFQGALTEVARARNALELAQAVAEEVVGEVIAAHSAAPVKKGGSVAGTVVEGRQAITYDAEDGSAKAPGDDVVVERHLA